MKRLFVLGLPFLLVASFGCSNLSDEAGTDRLTRPKTQEQPLSSQPVTVSFEAQWSAWIGRDSGPPGTTCDPDHYGEPVIPSTEGCQYLQLGRWANSMQGRTFIAVDFDTQSLPDCAVILSTWLEFSVVDVLRKSFPSQPPSPLECIECDKWGCGLGGWNSVTGTLQFGIGAAGIGQTAGCGTMPAVECIVSECGPYGIGGGMVWLDPYYFSAGDIIKIGDAVDYIVNPTGFTRYVVDQEPGEIPNNEYQVIMLQSHVGSMKPKLFVKYLIPEVVASTMQGSATTHANPSLMTLNFQFDGALAPDKFEVQYLLPGESWTTVTCNAPSSTCIFSGVNLQSTTPATCMTGTVKWKARIYKDCWGPWSVVKSFSASCFE